MMHMRARWFGLAGMMLLSLSFMAHAQQQCGWRQEGVIGRGWYDGGGGSCNSAQQKQTAPAIRWVSRWGAIAICHRLGHSGSTVNQKSKRDAKRVALQNCNTDGATDCEVALAYHDQCAALAWGGGFSVAAGAATIEEAAALAMRSCDTQGCEIVYSECSLPERIQ
ncbi:protein of unknown function [Dyella sp. OK004]|nr:protein of unknown function [Dyella sp. OK004]